MKLYQKFELITNDVPYDGELTVGLYVQNTIGRFWKRFKDLNFEITPPLNALRLTKVKGDYHSYTIAKNINRNAEYEIFENSKYNDVNRPEYECIVDYLNDKYGKR